MHKPTVEYTRLLTLSEAELAALKQLARAFRVDCLGMDEEYPEPPTDDEQENIANVMNRIREM